MARSVQHAKTLNSSEDSFGARLARLRKERGFTQVELGEKVGMIQALISDYELDKLRPYADVVARFSRALDVTADELLGVAPIAKANGVGQNRRFLRRIQAVDKLPKRDQDALLRTIDAFLVARKAS
jgi:transcriptional regulator with XRE-family HTH domain